MPHLIANSTFSTTVLFTALQGGSSWFLLLLTVCLEPVMLVRALLQLFAHFYTFVVEMLPSRLRVSPLLAVILL